MRVLPKKQKSVVSGFDLYGLHCIYTFTCSSSIGSLRQVNCLEAKGHHKKGLYSEPYNYS